MSAYYRELAEAFPSGFDPSASATVDYEGLSPPDGQFLVIDVNGLARGCGALRRLAPGVGEIKRMWLADELRGHGLGARLLSELERWALELGLTTVRLDTARYLDVAIALYRRHGYVEVDAYNDNVYAHHWFEKDLTSGG